MAFFSDLLARHRQQTPSQAGVCGQAMLTPPLAKKHPGLTILGFGILLAASALVCWLTWDLRNASMVEATEQHIRLAERGAAILAKEFEVDSLLMETIRISLANPTLASLPEEALHAELFDTIGNFGGIGEIMVTDPVGRVVQSLHAHGMLHREIGQRAYFQAHRDNPAIGLQISGPLPNPYDGEPMIVLTRRLQDRGGAFAGIVLASVRVSYLQAILGRTDAGPNRLMTVMRTDGHVLLQAPAALATATPASTDPALMAAAADMPSGAYIGESSITDAGSTPAGDVFPALVQPRPAPAGEPPPTQDRVKRLYGYRTLDNAPVVLSVGTAVSDVLAQWSSTAWLIGIGAVSLDTAAILMSIAIQRELRRRRAAELQAQVSERRLRLTIETIEDHAFFLIDRHGNVAVWNSKAKAMLGYNPEDIVGRSIDVLLMHTQALRTEPNPLAVSLAVGRWEAETECRRQDGTTFPAIIVLAGIFEADDVPVAHSVIIHDLTKQKRLEQRFRAMERMDAIGQVTSGVAHDFNNLLQAQIMSLELLQDRMDAASVERELSDVALNAAEQAARLTDQLLAFSRQQRLRPSPVCLSDLLVSVISLAQHSVGPNVRLCPVVASALPPVLVDSAQLQTALLNLIINGRDAIAGSGTITLHAYQADDGIEPPAGCTSRTGFLVMSVTDTGCGMDPSTAERACEPFFTTKGAQGSGLGLSMVQGFARQSGGDIRINSKPNRGTSVEIWLPCVPPGQAVEEERAQTTRARSAHILLVDDAPDVLLVLSAFLRGAGFAVTRAGNAREALWHLQRGTKFALLISDFLMPGMDGLDLAHQAHRSRPDLPVLIISGFAASDRLSNLPPGFALLRKPFRKEDLLAAVARLQGGPGESASGSAGPLGAGAVVEPSSWDEPPHSHELPPKPTSA
jgi:PAS domain S-box-containing protein